MGSDMNATTSNLSVWVDEKMACVRITGRANFTTSVDFKKLMQHLRETGPRKVVLELTDCLLMDSTFLGVLANEASKRATRQGDAPACLLELVNPNTRIRDLIENLGVDHLFQAIQGEGSVAEFNPVASDATVTREEITRTCLEAHETLMALNPANIPKFKDVAQFFNEALMKKE